LWARVRSCASSVGVFAVWLVLTAVALCATAPEQPIMARDAPAAFSTLRRDNVVFILWSNLKRNCRFSGTHRKNLGDCQHIGQAHYHASENKISKCESQR